MLSKISIKTEILFLIIGLFWGLFFLFINPPFQSPDEDDHLFKMWGYLRGDYTFKVLNHERGQILPDSFILISRKYQPMKFDFDVHTSKQEILSLKDIPLDKTSESFYAQTPTGYTILSYIPAIFVLAILKFLNVPPLFMLYILRFCCLLTYLAIMYQAIKITPYKKWLFFILALLPNNLYIAGSINPDCIVISISALLIAYTLKLKFDNNIKEITSSHIIKWSGLFTFLCILKYLYFPFILLYFLLPKEKFPNPKKYLKPCIITANICLLYIILFVGMIVIMSTLGVDKYHKDSLSTILIIKYIFTHPVQYISGLIITTALASFSYIISLISHFGWEPFSINNIGIIAFYILIFAMVLYENNNDEEHFITPKEKLLMFTISAICYIIILTSVSIIYRQFPLVIGFQGRYASPYALLLFFLFTSTRIKLKNKYIPLIVIAILQILFIQCAYTIIGRFY